MQVRDLEFNVKVQGDGDLPLVWGHGLMANMEAEDSLNWFGWGDFPADAKLVRYDARGHGKTEPTFAPEDYHWKNLAKDMIALADGLGIETFIAGGSSMGCATTIYAALQAPERVKRMLLVIPPTAWETRAAQGAMYEKFSKIGGLLGGGMMVKMLKRNMDRMLPPWMIEASPEMLDGMADGMKSLHRKTMKNLFLGASLTDFPSREVVRSLDIPALILAWVDDATHPVGTAEELHSLLPQSELVIAQGYEDSLSWPARIRAFVTK